MTEDREALLAAVTRLVSDDDAAHSYGLLCEVIPVARRVGVRFSGANEWMNPLLDLGVARPEHYDNVMLLVETKRQGAGLPPLDQKRTEVDKFDKVEYMAEFMRRKRERERKAAEIENMIRPERDRLIGRARLDFMQAQSAKWKAGLDARIASVRGETGKRLTADQLEAVRRNYWDEVDRDLDELESYARAEMLKPPHLRRKV